ncbi:MAG: ABC transporter substrate-binding protein [Thermoplasmata archaeon]
MNKKALYAVIAVVVVIILVVAVLEVIPTSSSASMTVSTSATTATAGQSITFAAYISGGTPSSVVFNFGDGNTGTATHLSGNEYTVTHSYSSAGSYLVTATATVNGKTVDNMKSINEISVTPASVSPTVASEITVPSIITSTQIFAPGSTVSLTASTLQPPTAANWTIGYYIWNFGDGSTHTNYTVFNTSSGTFMADNISHLYSTAGIYTVTLGVITFNATNYVPTTYTSNGINYTYYPVSELSSILSSGQYQNTTYMSTIVVNSTAQLLKSSAPHTNPNEITVIEVAPGGPYSFDPAVDYDIIGYEDIENVYETLIQYNGSSVSQSQMFPMVASEIPTVANGGISANYLNYTFHIRSGLKFANGDPVTAWDAYTSYIRTLLFVADSPGTAGWILAQDLLPGGGFGPNGTSYQSITRAVTVDNTTQSVTFHLLKPDPAFLDYVANPEGTAIMDYSWLVTHGAGITFTPAGFSAYINQGNESDYNLYVRYHAMGSGPYMIKSYLIGQSIILVPNPYYTPIPGIPGYDHAANDTIYIQWEKDPSTALLMAESGQADIVDNLPNYDYPILSQLASEGKMNITSFPTLTIDWFQFNFNINVSMLSTLGLQYHVPQYYFTNLDVRRAFAYAFNYTNYIDNLLGNSRYGADFGFHYTGIIPLGMPGYMNDSQLQQAGAVVPVYNLSIAKHYMEESGLYNTSVNIPIIVESGDPIDYAAAQEWAATLNLIDPNIVASALYMEFDQITGYVAQQNPMPIYYGQWGPDFPYPSDYIVPMYSSSGFFGGAAGWNVTTLEAGGQYNETKIVNLTNQYILDAQTTGNSTLALSLYDKAEVLAVNLTFYVYLYQENGFWFYSPALHGVLNEENPINNGGGVTVYIYLSK